MVGIWLLNEWLQAKQPKSVRLVELGPGRGTLMADILRVSVYEIFTLKCPTSPLGVTILLHLLINDL